MCQVFSSTRMMLSSGVKSSRALCGSRNGCSNYMGGMRITKKMQRENTRVEEGFERIAKSKASKNRGGGAQAKEQVSPFSALAH